MSTGFQKDRNIERHSDRQSDRLTDGQTAVFITKKPDWGTQKKDQIRTPYFAKYRLNTDWRKQIKDCHKSCSRRDTEH